MKWLSAAHSYPLSGNKEFYLSKSPHPQEVVTDHLVEAPHPFGLYSVTRVNPLYSDETNEESPSESRLTNKPVSDLEEHDCKTDYLHTNPLRRNVSAVVKQNSDFIRSILVSVRLDHKHNNDLTPIPEGRTDTLSHAVQHAADESSEENRHNNAIHIEKPPRYKHKRWKADADMVRSPMAADKRKTFLEILRELSVSINNAMENANQVEIPPEAVLRSLREKINKCLESCAFSSHFTDTGGSHALKDDAVVTLSRAFSFINSFNHGSQDSLDGGRLLLLKRLGKFSGAEPFYEHVRHSSSSSSSSNTSTSGFSDLTHTPASSNASASSSPPISRTDGMQLAAVDIGANRIIKSDNTDNVYCNNNKNNYNNDNNNFINIKNNNLNNDIRNDSGNHKRHNYVINCDNAKDALTFNSFEYSVIQNEANFNIARSVLSVAIKETDDLKTTIYTKSDSLLSTYYWSTLCKSWCMTYEYRRKPLCLPGQYNVLYCRSCGGDSYPITCYGRKRHRQMSYPGRRCPDFTLDVQQAEMVMKKVKERKKERCYCRMVTSFVGFAFLLFSVMFFSMMLTRGEKMFGSL